MIYVLNIDKLSGDLMGIVWEIPCTMRLIR